MRVMPCSGSTSTASSASLPGYLVSDALVLEPIRAPAVTACNLRHAKRSTSMQWPILYRTLKCSLAGAFTDCFALANIGV